MTKSRLYCIVPDCAGPYHARSLCSRHYVQWQRGKALPIPVPDAHPRTPEERFWEKVNKNGPLWNGTHCWNWIASTIRAGYGQFKTNDRISMHRAHKWAYEQLVGPVPDGMELDHLCRRRSCVRPIHLETVTHLENVRRGRGNGSQTHCPQGHPYSLENTYVNKSGRTYRRCKICIRKRQSSSHIRVASVPQNGPT